MQNQDIKVRIFPIIEPKSEQKAPFNFCPIFRHTCRYLLLLLIIAIPILSGCNQVSRSDYQKVTAIEVIPNVANLEVGQSIQFQAKITLEDGTVRIEEAPRFLYCAQSGSLEAGKFTAEYVYDGEAEILANCGPYFSEDISNPQAQGWFGGGPYIDPRMIINAKVYISPAKGAIPEPPRISVHTDHNNGRYFSATLCLYIEENAENYEVSWGTDEQAANLGVVSKTWQNYYSSSPHKYMQLMYSDRLSERSDQGVRYYVKVRAVNRYGKGGYCAPAIFVVPTTAEVN